MPILFRAFVWIILALWLGIGILVQAASGAPPEFPKVSNYAVFVRELQGMPFFHWRVFIDEPAEVLERIAAVQYELHPSFDDPVQIRTDPANQFALERGGWGEFRLPLTIQFKDGTRVTTSYRLDLRKPWPSDKPAPVLP